MITNKKVGTSDF